MGMVVKEKKEEKWPVGATYVYPNGERKHKVNVRKEDIEAAEMLGINVEVD